MNARRIRALGLAAALVAWSLVVPRLPSRWHPVPHAVVGTALAALTRGPLGIRHPAAGARIGLVAAIPIVLVVALSAALPRVRTEMAGRELPDGALQWLLLGIPLGTVWSEEAAFRGALGTVAADAFGPTGGRLVQAAAFGLSHIADARSTGEPVVPTVLVTGLAGWAFGWLYDRSGGLIAPMLAHLAVNESGAVAALAVQRIRSAHGQR
ncbi:CPBP family intramembrane metalloprotease [Mycobacterium barrassiae]|uniref:Rv0804 family intramembrane glutamic endopeptidase n=1 Tax=Mycobacterium barrassiae TaxID=319709 RepID=UPI002265C351|nr:CPBP family intramembrane glutamic endopeptidase [Mycobacterium barrassiae]MCV7303273.1 CPBP family intramembrane metalloprotease [Mycobacterium barrassiae]